jgi:hypothetical protein
MKESVRDYMDRPRGNGSLVRFLCKVIEIPPPARAGLATACIAASVAFLFEVAMKHQYRVLIETIIEKKKKLATAVAMKHDAEQALMQANGYVDLNTASLDVSEQALRELEVSIFGLEAQG